MILTATPYRISLFGGGTDYPEWYREHGGMVVGLTINQYCFIGIQPAPPGQGVNYRITYSKIEDRDTVDDIAHPAVRGVLKHKGINTPLDVHYMGDLPSGGGLGASSAFVVGLLRALQAAGRPYTYADGFDHFDRSAHSPYDLAKEAIHVERNVIQEAVGDQDQFFAAYGGLRYFKFKPDGTVITAPVQLAAYRVLDSMVLVYTGTMRYAHEMAAKVISTIPHRRMQMHRLAVLAQEGLDALEQQDLPEVAKVLHYSWMVKRALHVDISLPYIDSLYEHGLACGALGGKLLGAGGGGFMLFLVPPEKRAAFEEKIKAPCVRVGLAPYGCRVISGGLHA